MPPPHGTGSTLSIGKVHANSNRRPNVSNCTHRDVTMVLFSLCLGFSKTNLILLEHNLQVGDKVLVDNQLFVAKNKKFSPMWIGPFEITKIINKQNVEVKIKNRTQIYNVCRLKKFTNPESSKFHCDKSIKKHTVESDGEIESKQIAKGEVTNKSKKANELIKDSIERRITRSMKLISREEQSINAINALIIPEADRYKLTAIALKLHQAIPLTTTEKQYWNNFTNQEKAYIITGDSQQTLDFTQYQEGYFSGDYWNYLARPVQPIPQNATAPEADEDSDPDLFADEPPLSSSSEDSIPVFRRTGTKDSGFNPLSDDSRSHQSARTSPPINLISPKPGTSKQTDNEPESSDEFSTPPQSLQKQRGRPKGSKNIKRVYFDPEAIGQRTRAKFLKGEYDDDGDYLMPVLNDAVIVSCTTENNGNLPVSSGDLLGQWTFFQGCQLPACQDSCKQNTKKPQQHADIMGLTNTSSTNNLNCKWQQFSH